MSKSKGNTIEPADGHQRERRRDPAPVGRRWSTIPTTSGSARPILQTTVDAYRKLRNTVRYLLGALAGFDDGRAPSPLDRDAAAGALHPAPPVGAGWPGPRGLRRLPLPGRGPAGARVLLRTTCRRCIFDIRKDSLYCDRPDAIRRRAARTVMDAVFERLTAWLAPADRPSPWKRPGRRASRTRGSNCLRVIPETPADWRNDAEAARWAKVQAVLRVVTGALEVERREKRIGGGAGGRARWSPAAADAFAAFDGLDAAEVFRTSGAELADGRRRGHGRGRASPTIPNAPAPGAACPTSAPTPPTPSSAPATRTPCAGGIPGRAEPSTSRY